MRYSKEYLQSHFDTQNIPYDDDDIRRVQMILDFISEGEEKLDQFDNIQSTKIFLRNNMEVIDHD
ncbi:hypothetical protein [Aerococcus kribbianus]|uniref:Uncharacterized protein n=1 Tax=Aerococcus kribbianus TaxID=2999064 RepID=A0A9X3FN92_9LACT|nr:MULTISPECIES: hypothetical protein [unclassified Aerococcus]MCZ0717550.1 hypothetical protein [Aerococcus sp. YH-aer221]MCZ0725838.1 hypothetical protein [Aerococcus sp. YH-aer222]